MVQTARAVICREMMKPVVVERITVSSPKRGEVMVKLAACGVCHSDLSATNGTIPLQTARCAPTTPRARRSISFPAAA